MGVGFAEVRAGDSVDLAGIRSVEVRAGASADLGGSLPTFNPCPRGGLRGDEALAVLERPRGGGVGATSRRGGVGGARVLADRAGRGGGAVAGEGAVVTGEGAAAGGDVGTGGAAVSAEMGMSTSRTSEGESTGVIEEEIVVVDLREVEVAEFCELVVRHLGRGRLFLNYACDQSSTNTRCIEV